MSNKILITLFLSLIFCFSAQTQEEKPEKNKTEDKKEEIKPEDVVMVLDSTQLRKPIDPLSPSRAAFYSAILPGLGQAYNKKYWKIPIVYAALGTGIYFYSTNNRDYKRVRDAYKRRLAGFQDDEFQDRLTDDGLREAQKSLRRNKELSLLITAGLYALNIIDANVDAHLLQYNVDDNLSFKPHYKIDEFDNSKSVGLTLNFEF